MANLSPFAAVRQQQADDAAPPQLAPVDFGQAAQPVIQTAAPQVARIPTPLEDQIQGDQARLQRVHLQQQPWDYKAHGKARNIAHVFSTIGNIAGDVVAPGTMANIPGTQMYDAASEANLSERLAKEQQEESEENLQGAQGDEAKAQAHNLENPPSTPIETAGGYFSYNPRTQATAPINGPNGKPLQPYTKPGPRQHVFLAGSDGKAVAATFDPQTGTYFDAHDNPIANPQPYEKPTPAPAPPHITAMKGGQPHIMERDPQTGEYSIDRGVAPESYGQMVIPTKTATFIDPKSGLPVEMQWNPQTQTYDKPLGLSASNAYGHEAAQAGAVDRAAQDLIGDIESNRDKLGNTQAIVQSAILGTPWADPQTAELRSRIATFAALQPSMHGFRGQDAMRQFEKILGGIPNNPDALIAAINGITTTAGAINPGLKKGSTGQPAAGGTSGGKPDYVFVPGKGLVKQ